MKKKRYMVINGPNLNMLGIREKEIYGEKNYEALCDLLRKTAEKYEVELEIRQSNHEGDLVDWIQEAYFEAYDGIILNPAAYTHTSLAIADAIKAIRPLPVVEVHLSDISEREEYRHHSFSQEFCVAQIKGLGFQSYVKALELLIDRK